MNAPTTTAAEFAREELAGKLLALCVGQLEKLRNPWNMTSEANQQIALNAMRDAVEKAVREAVLVIATDRHPHLKATVESVTFKDGIKAVLTVDRSNAMRHDLADAEGGTIIVTIVHPETYSTGAEKVSAMPDQPALALDGDKPPAEALPEIKPMQDGTYTIYKDGAPMPGGKGFASQQDAETWLQKTLGIEKKRRKPRGETTAPEIPPPATEPETNAPVGETIAGEGETTAADPPPAGQPLAAEDAPPPAPLVPAPKLEDVIADFKQAATEEAKKGNRGDWDQAFKLVSSKYPPEFVDEFFTELDAAWADGWEEGSK